VTGDCSTIVGVSRLSAVQVYESDAFKLGSFDAVCKGKPVYKITKTKDMSNCKSVPAWHSTTSGVHECDFGKGNCGDFIKVNKINKRNMNRIAGWGK
jgi:Lipoprotein amino terminal region